MNHKVAVTSVHVRVKQKRGYWKSWVWQEQRPLIMFLVSGCDQTILLHEELVSLRIKNYVWDRNRYGGVVVGFLQTEANASEELTANHDTVKELVALTEQVDQVVIATGWLEHDQLSKRRLHDYIQACRVTHQIDKLVWLLSEGGRKIKPTTVTDSHWYFGPVQ